MGVINPTLYVTAEDTEAQRGKNNRRKGLSADSPFLIQGYFYGSQVGK